MMRTYEILTYLFFSLAVGGWTIAAELPKIELTNWQPRFQGVELIRGVASLADEAHPDDNVQRGVALRIDLAAPGIVAVFTPGNGEQAKETSGTTTSAFAKKHDLELAINIHFFAPCCEPVAGEPKDLIGLAVSDGKLVSPWEEKMPDVLMIRNDNSVAFTSEQPNSMEGVTAGFSGQQLLSEGQITVRERQDRFATTRHPRTAIGLSEDGQHLFLLVIDGRRPGHSAGATLVETAHWLQQLGGRDGINVDGGGSTTLVIADSNGQPVFLNRVSGKAERVVGSVLGFHAERLEAASNGE